MRAVVGATKSGSFSTVSPERMRPGRRLTIAVVVGGFPKLSEPFILDQITGLIDLGHEVDIYARRRLREDAVHPEVRQYSLLSRTHAFDLPLRRAGRLLRGMGLLARYIPRHAGCVLRCLNLTRYGSVYAVLNNLMHVGPFLTRHYDVILCQFGGNGIDFAFLKDLFPTVRFVTMFHGDDYFLADEQGPAVFDRLRQVGDLFLVNTDHFGGTKLRSVGFDPHKIVTFHLPARLPPFRERARSADRLVVLSVGRLVPKKGHAFGIRGIAQLQDDNPGLRIEYRIIGEGELRAPLTALIQQLGRVDTIQLLGGLTREKVLQWMGASDIFLLPSLMEQAGMVLAEAQASGLPVVATHVGGVPEMVKAGQSAHLIEPGDSRAIASAIQRLLDEPASWASMGRAGRRLVETQHDPGTQALRLATLLAS
jgi:colanic acid/amylovoran biosynthesis glycosyltransferase